jgi:hypothetical protein
VAPVDAPYEPPAPPWIPYVGAAAVPSSLGLEQRTLIGVALVLSRAPLAARTSRFQRAFHAWRRAEQRPPDAIGFQPKPAACSHEIATRSKQPELEDAIRSGDTRLIAAGRR